jgi:hypothetical protein
VENAHALRRDDIAIDGVVADSGNAPISFDRLKR